MKRIFTNSLAIAAAALMFTGCSSDEPNNNGGNLTPGESAYLSVSIRDANGLTRAAEFENGTPTEGQVNNAHFYFFNDNGIYVGQATIWNGGTVKPDGGNIELEGKSVVVLDNLKGTKYPKYMVTLLNVGSQFPNNYFTDANLEGKDIKEFGADLTSWGSTEGGFLMATTSYFQGDNSDKQHNDAYYYATQLDESNFKRTAEAAVEDQNPVKVYVERLAARVELTSNTFFPVDVTVMGADGDNPETDPGKPGEGDQPATPGSGIAGTKLTVKIVGWYLNGIQQQSHLSKQLYSDAFKWDATTVFAGGATAADNWNWNIPTFHRSYWGQSVGYNAQTEDGLQFFAWSKGDHKNAGAGSYAYCNENTSTVANLSANNNNLPNQRLMTSVVVKAFVGTSDDGNGKNFKPIYLVEHNGVYFTKERFIDYVLDNVKRKGQLNYYTRTGTQESGYQYTLVKASMFEIGGTNEEVFVQPGSTFPTSGLYKKIGEKEYVAYENVAAEIETLKGNLKDVTKNVRTRAFKDGMMYYNIPIKHLNNVTYTTDGDLDKWYEGSFGVVRNHAYKLNIKSVKRLGQGVFDPDNEVIKPDPDPKDPNWFLGAQINVLAWKIVSSNIDL